MTKIYLIRHAQAEGNLYRMMQGHWDGGVTELGWQQIRALAERFRDIPVDAVYASDLYRARMTAGAVAGPRGLELRTDPQLREMNMGPWETKFFANLSREQPGEIDLFLHHPERFQVPGVEGFAQVGERMRQALERIARRHTGETVAVVSHGAAIRAFLALASGLALSDGEALPFQHNTAVNTLLWEEGRFQVLEMDNFSHILPLGGREWTRTPALRDEAVDPLREADFYTDCYREAWIAAHGNLSGFYAPLYLNAAAEHYRADRRAIRMALDGDRPVGLLDMDTRRGEEDGVGWLSLIYLLPEYRGMGCGIQLLARALFYYRELGRASLRLNVAEENAKARLFYQRQGFRTLGRGGDGLLLMERSLGGPEE